MADTTLFYQGEPCKYGHNGLRYTNGSRNCVECCRKRAREHQRSGYRSPVSLHPLYKRWQCIKNRCYNPRFGQYKDYGGRNITICERWRNSFWAFVADVIAEIGPPPSAKHTIDRINNDGNYEPGNIRWATAIVQNRNSRWAKLTLEDARLIRRLYVKGVSYHPGNITELMTRFSVSADTIYKILKGERWREE